MITEKYINCITHVSSDCNLLLAKETAVAFDCGMAFCAADTIAAIKKALRGRELKMLFLTHTHYDHAGALPYFRKQWKDLKVAVSKTGAEFLLRDTPRRVIRELSAKAAQAYGGVFDNNYSDDCFKADIELNDGDEIRIDEFTIKAVETPGHTRDSVSYLVRELDLFIMCETQGVIIPTGSIYPTYLTGCADTLKSISKSAGFNCKHLSVAHHGLANADITKDFFKKAEEAVKSYRDFILLQKANGLDEEGIVNALYNKYATKELLSVQPEAAFMINARAAAACTLREG